MRQKTLWVAWSALVVCCATSTALAAGVISQNAAARFGLARGWFAQVASSRGTGPITYLRHDQGMLIVQTKLGLLSGMDAETGRIFWTAQVGPRNHLSSEAAVNAEHVAVVNGSVLYVLDRASGNLLWQRQLVGSPGSGPALSTTHVFVTMTSGFVEGYDLAKGAKQRPWTYKSAGHVMVRPLATPQTVSWTTEKGFFYVADPQAQGIRYRLETRDAIHARPAFWTPELYACSTDGFVYAVNEQTGKIDWKFAAGDALYASPVAIEGRVYVISEFGNMYCLDGKTGEQLWLTPSIAQFLSASPTRIYVCDLLEQMVVLDAKSGVRLGAMPLSGMTLKLVNQQSDRIYLAHESGVLQCLHEADLKTPVIYTPPAPPKVEVKAPPKGEKKPKASIDPDEPATDDASMDEPAMEDESPPMEDEPADEPAEDKPEENPFG